MQLWIFYQSSHFYESFLQFNSKIKRKVHKKQGVIFCTGHPTDNSDTSSSPSLSQIICVKVYFNIYGQKWLSRNEWHIQKWVFYQFMGFSHPMGVFMGIIYMDFYYNRRDDMILSMSPLILLFFITQVDDVLKYLIVAMIISNVTYWNCKNIYTFTLDSLFATTFIAYLFYKCMKLGLCIHTCPMRWQVI